MKLTKYFKLFESRSANLSQDEFFKLLKENCKQFINNPKALQRLKESGDTYSYINPKIHSRKDGSADIAINIMLFMDNLPSWKEYPKRENSLIGIGTLTGMNDYSYGDEIYLIIPYDNSKFGNAPTDDLWGSKIPIIRVSEENSDISDEYSILLSMFQSLLKYLTLNQTLNSYNELIDYLQAVYSHYLNNPESLKIESGYYKNIVKDIFKMFKKDNITNIEDGLDKLLSPNILFSSSNKDTHFNLYTYDELEKTKSEIWTDSECLLYHLGSYNSCYQCDNTGNLDCETCDGSGYENCTDCDGRGNFDCEECDGDGCDGCNYGEVECSECNGKGDYICTDCKGEGSFDCDYCNGDSSSYITSADDANTAFQHFVIKIKKL